MSIDFTGVTAVAIPEGSVTKIVSADGRTIWEAAKLDPVLNNNSWADIAWAAKTGNIPSTWKIGDQKIVVGGDPTDGYINIAFDFIGRNHDSVDNPSKYGKEKAGMTFQCHNVMYSHVMTESPNIYSTLPNWANCNARTYIKNMYWLSEVLPYIVPVAKETKTGENTTIFTTDTVFYLSVKEITGDSSYASDKETQYEYYANGGFIAKTTITDDNYWKVPVSSNFYATRTTYSGSIYYINTDGRAAISPSINNIYACPAFCL